MMGARVAIVCDMIEEGWESMDLVGDMLQLMLEREHADRIVATQVRPLLTRRASRVRSGYRYSPAAGPTSRFLFNMDRLANRFWDYPRHLRRVKQAYDVFHIVDHSYAQLIHDLPPERTIVTCHDVEAFRCLLEPSAARSWLHKAMAKRTLSGLRKAARVTCDSNAVREEILAHELLPEDRLIVAHNGVHPACSPDRDPVADSDVARLLGMPADGEILLLHVGSTIPRKRLDVLLRVFSGVRTTFPRARLVRAGGPFTPPQARLVNELGLGDSVTVLPYVERRVLAAVYRRAALVLQPSEAEGFGLPVVEAMACGAPVVASDLPVLREVGGEVTTYLPVADIAAWTQGVSAMIAERERSPALWAQRRDESIAHAARFSWSQYGRRMVALYNDVLAS